MAVVGAVIATRTKLVQKSEHDGHGPVINQKMASVGWREPLGSCFWVG